MNSINGAAIVRYNGSMMEDPLSTTEAVDQAEGGETMTNRLAMTTNPAEKCGNPGNLCVTEVHALRKMPSYLAEPKMEVTIRLPINYKLQMNEFVGMR